MIISKVESRAAGTESRVLCSFSTPCLTTNCTPTGRPTDVRASLPSQDGACEGRCFRSCPCLMPNNPVGKMRMCRTDCLFLFGRERRVDEHHWARLQRNRKSTKLPPQPHQPHKAPQARVLELLVQRQAIRQPHRRPTRLHPTHPQQQPHLPPPQLPHRDQRLTWPRCERKLNGPRRLRRRS